MTQVLKHLNLLHLRHVLSWTIVACVAAASSPSYANEEADGEPSTDGMALATAVHDRPDGTDMVFTGNMVLESGRGTRNRVFNSFRLTRDDGSEVSLIRFTDPANIAKTGLLVDSAVDGVWLYLPALDRVRRISSENKGGRFVNSQLYYEDLQNRSPDEDVHRLLGEGDYEGVATSLLESTPVDAENSAYTKRLSWIHPDLLIPLRVDFYEGSDAPSKRLEVLQVDEIQGFWTVTDSRVTDLESGATTRIAVEAVNYDQGLSSSLFTTNALASPSPEELQMQP